MARRNWFIRKSINHRGYRGHREPQREKRFKKKKKINHRDHRWHGEIGLFINSNCFLKN